MPDVKTIHGQGQRAYQAAMIEAEAQFRQAQLDDDLASATEAAMKINNLNVAMNNWDRMANEVQRQQPAAGPPPNKHGLSPDEVEIAHGLGNGRLSRDEAEKLYAEKKQLYRDQRASGEYRDDQGRVTR